MMIDRLTISTCWLTRYLWVKWQYLRHNIWQLIYGSWVAQNTCFVNNVHIGNDKMRWNHNKIRIITGTRLSLYIDVYVFCKYRILRRALLSCTSVNWLNEMKTQYFDWLIWKYRNDLCWIYFNLDLAIVGSPLLLPIPHC